MADVVRDFRNQFYLRSIINFSQSRAGKGVEKSMLLKLFLAGAYADEADFEQACGNLLMTGAASVDENGVFTLNNLPELP